MANYIVTWFPYIGKYKEDNLSYLRYAYVYLTYIHTK